MRNVGPEGASPGQALFTARSLAAVAEHIDCQGGKPESCEPARPFLYVVADAPGFMYDKYASTFRRLRVIASEISSKDLVTKAVIKVLCLHFCSIVTANLSGLPDVGREPAPSREPHSLVEADRGFVRGCHRQADGTASVNGK